METRLQAARAVADVPPEASGLAARRRGVEPLTVPLAARFDA